ncbi:MAG TPA: hypothetical protein VFC46_03215 [Humisphaera sp.]|nr:hypothetical protein [Humisphaera sp.]
MMNRTAWGLFLICMTAIAGCAPNETPRPFGVAPPPEITSAIYYDNKNRENVYITGAYFKLQSDNRIDVVASIDGHTWVQARKIMESSPTVYKATIPYNSSYPNVYVRVFGMNGDYSPPVLVHLY